jgi:hypothetical protein
MAQSRRGVTQVLEAQTHPLAVAIPRFIQLMAPLPPLKPSELPHAVIEPLVLKAAKALSVE